MAIRNDDWRAQGACVSADPELFFPIASSGLAMVQLRRAKVICGRCPVRRQCLEFALSMPDVHGVWGGTSDRERGRMLAARRENGAMASSGRRFS